MKARCSLAAGLLILSFLLGSQVAVAKTVEKSPIQKRLLSLYLTHGGSYLKTPELERLDIARSAFAIGAGAGYDLTSDFTISTELLFVDSIKKVGSDYSSASTSAASNRYHQDRLTLGGTFKMQVAKCLVLLPEAGLSFNHFKITLTEHSYRVVTSQRSLGWYLGFGSIVPIKRVFFDFRYKYQGVKLKMERIGADEMMFQSTILAGFGFVI